MLKKSFRNPVFIRFEELFNSQCVRLILIAVISLQFFSSFLMEISYEEFHYSEFQNSAFAMLMGRGENPYQPMHSTMVPIGCYGPLSYFVPAIVGRILRTVYSPHLFLLTFRFIVFGYFLGLLFLLFLIFKKITANINYSLLFLIAFSHHPGWVTGTISDWQALFYVVFALYMFLRLPPDSIVTYLLIGICCGIAFLNLQRVVAFFCAVILYLVSYRKTKYALFAILSFCVTVFLVLGIFWLYSKGNILVHSFLVFRALADRTIHGLHGIYKGNALRLLTLFFIAAWSFFLSALRSASSTDRFIRIYALTCFLTIIPGIYFIPASENHFRESVFVSCLLISFIFNKENNSLSATPELYRKLRILFIMIVLTYILNDVYVNVRYWRAELLHRRGRYDVSIGYESYLANIPKGPMLSDNMHIAYKTNHPEATAQTDFYLAILKKENKFDTSLTAKRIKERYYASIITTGESDIYKEFKNEIRDNYHTIFFIRNEGVWVPKNK